MEMLSCFEPNAADLDNRAGRCLSSQRKPVGNEIGSLKTEPPISLHRCKPQHDPNNLAETARRSVPLVCRADQVFMAR